MSNMRIFSEPFRRMPIVAFEMRTLKNVLLFWFVAKWIPMTEMLDNKRLVKLLLLDEST